MWFSQSKTIKETILKKNFSLNQIVELIAVIEVFHKRETRKDKNQGKNMHAKDHKIMYW